MGKGPLYLCLKLWLAVYIITARKKSPFRQKARRDVSVAMEDALESGASSSQFHLPGTPKIQNPAAFGAIEEACLSMCLPYRKADAYTHPTTSKTRHRPHIIGIHQRKAILYDMQKAKRAYDFGIYIGLRAVVVPVIFCFWFPRRSYSSF